MDWVEDAENYERSFEGRVFFAHAHPRNILRRAVEEVRALRKELEDTERLRSEAMQGFLSWRDRANHLAVKVKSLGEKCDHLRKERDELLEQVEQLKHQLQVERDNAKDFSDGLKQLEQIRESEKRSLRDELERVKRDYESYQRERVKAMEASIHEQMRVNRMMSEYGLSPLSMNFNGPPKTLRDEFAMAALTKIIDHFYIFSDAKTLMTVQVEALANTAYAIADAMMEARKK